MALKHKLVLGLLLWGLATASYGADCDTLVVDSAGVISDPAKVTAAAEAHYLAERRCQH